MIRNPALLPKVRAPKALKLIEHMGCNLRVSSLYPGYSCSSDETVVPCHIPTIGKGMSTKVSDLFVAAGCQHCHDIIDGRDRMRRDFIAEKYPAALAMRMLDGMAETQSRLVAVGALTLIGMEVI